MVYVLAVFVVILAIGGGHSSQGHNQQHLKAVRISDEVQNAVATTDAIVPLQTESLVDIDDQKDYTDEDQQQVPVSDMSLFNLTTTSNVTTPNEDTHSAIESYVVQPIVGDSDNKTDQWSVANRRSMRVWFESSVTLHVNENVTKATTCCGATSLRSTDKAYITFSSFAEPSANDNHSKCSGCHWFQIGSITCTVPPYTYKKGVDTFKSVSWQCYTPSSNLNRKYNHSLYVVCPVIKTHGDLNVCVHEGGCNLQVRPHPDAGDIVPARLRFHRSPLQPTMATVVLILAGVLLIVALIVAFILSRNWGQ